MKAIAGLSLLALGVAGFAGPLTHGHATIAWLEGVPWQTSACAMTVWWVTTSITAWGGATILCDVAVGDDDPQD